MRLTGDSIPCYANTENDREKKIMFAYFQACSGALLSQRQFIIAWALTVDQIGQIIIFPGIIYFISYLV